MDPQIFAAISAAVVAFALGVFNVVTTRKATARAAESARELEMLKSQVATESNRLTEFEKHSNLLLMDRYQRLYEAYGHLLRLTDDPPPPPDAIDELIQAWHSRMRERRRNLVGWTKGVLPLFTYELMERYVQRINALEKQDREEAPRKSERDREAMDTIRRAFELNLSTSEFAKALEIDVRSHIHALAVPHSSDS